MLVNLDWLVGEFNNFQQFWQENTEEDLHRIDTNLSHQHIHFECLKSEKSNNYFINLYKGRDKKELLSKHLITAEDNQYYLDGKILSSKNNSFNSDDIEITLTKDDGLHISGLGPLEKNKSNPYRLLPCRYFSGWIQYPPDLDSPDDLYSLRDLKIHDQGGCTELQKGEICYTVELTQLVYAKTLSIMKLAVYDIPKSELNVNSKAISYTWVNPDSKRIGINIRRVLSGWTFIEPGYISSNNNLNKKN